VISPKILQAYVQKQVLLSFNSILIINLLIESGLTFILAVLIILIVLIVLLILLLLICCCVLTNCCRNRIRLNQTEIELDKTLNSYGGGSKSYSRVNDESNPKKKGKAKQSDEDDTL
jgi:hypothetical protein